MHDFDQPWCGRHSSMPHKRKPDVHLPSLCYSLCQAALEAATKAREALANEKTQLQTQLAALE